MVVRISSPSISPPMASVRTVWASGRWSHASKELNEPGLALDAFWLPRNREEGVELRMEKRIRLRQSGPALRDCGHITLEPDG